MASPYRLLELDVENLPEDVKSEAPLPNLGADPAAASLTPRVSYLLSRIDGMTPLGELLPAIPLAPKDLLEALLLLHIEQLISFSPEFAARYLEARPSRQPPAPSPAAPPAPPAAARTIPPAAGRATPAAAIAPAVVTGTVPPAGDGPRFTVLPGQSERASLPPAGAAGKPPPAAAALSIETKGDLSARPLSWLGRELKTARWTGLVTLRRLKAEKRLWFFGGEPVQVESNVPEEELGTLMHAKGKIDDPAFAKYQAKRKEGKPPAAALVEIGTFQAADAGKADRWRAQASLFDALQWRAGTYELEPAGSFPDGVPRYDLGYGTLLLKAWRETPFEDTRRKFFDAHRNWFLVVPKVPDEVMGKLRLNPKEDRLLQALQEQTRRIRDVFEITSLFLMETYKFIDGLLAMGLADLVEHNPAEAGPVDTRDLKNVLESMEGWNFFERLSTHPVSTNEDIDEAHRRVRPLYEPARYRNLGAQTRETLEKILKLLDEAHEHLRDAARRKKYRAEKYTRQRLEYFAELQYKKGEIFLFWRDDPRTAFAIFESSYEMCPDVPLYAACYALSLVRAFPGETARRREAQQVLERGLARGAESAKVLVIAAAALRHLGDVGRSDQLCRQALKVSNNAADIAKMVEQVRTQQA